MLLTSLLLPSSSFLILIPLASLVTLLLTVMTLMMMVVLDFPLRHLSLLSYLLHPAHLAFLLPNFSFNTHLLPFILGIKSKIPIFTYLYGFIKCFHIYHLI